MSICTAGVEDAVCRHPGRHEDRVARRDRPFVLAAGVIDPLHRAAPLDDDVELLEVGSVVQNPAGHHLAAMPVKDMRCGARWHLGHAHEEARAAAGVGKDKLADQAIAMQRVQRCLRPGQDARGQPRRTDPIAARRPAHHLPPAPHCVAFTEAT
jgi:hypothetical protein